MAETKENQSVINQKTLAFNEKIESISSKYNRWFNGRNNKFTVEPDTINNYFRCFTTTNGEVQLHIKEGLPLEIGKDCRMAFKSVFEN